METPQERAGVGPDASQPTGEQRGGCELCFAPSPHDVTWLYHAALREPESADAPQFEAIRLCDVCAHYLKTQDDLYYGGCWIAGDLVGRAIAFRRPIDESRETGRVIRDVPEHNGVVIAPSGEGRFGRFERVIHRANILSIEVREVLYPEVRYGVRYAS